MVGNCFGHTHTWLLPTTNAVVIQALCFWFCVLLFATAVVPWTTQTLSFINLNFAWQIVGFEFQCHQGLLSSFPHLLLPWSYSSFLGLPPAGLLWYDNMAVYPGWTLRSLCTVLYPGSGAKACQWVPAMASFLRAFSIHVSLKIHGCHFHRKAIFSCVYNLCPSTQWADFQIFFSSTVFLLQVVHCFWGWEGHVFNALGPPPVKLFNTAFKQSRDV